MEIEQLAVERPEALARVAGRRRHRRRRGQGRARSSPRPSSRPTSPTRSPTIAGAALGGLRRRGRHARRGQPAGPDPGRPRSSRSTARSPSTTTPSSGTRTLRRRTPTRPPTTRSRPRPRRRTSTTSSSTARSASSATARGWSCRTLDVVAYAGEKHGGVKPANFLDIGGGASAEVMANGLEIILSDPRRASRSSSTSSAASPPATRWPTASCRRSSMLGDAATKPLVVRLDGNNVEEGRRILAEADHPLVTLGRHHGRRGRQGRRARERARA